MQLGVNTFENVFFLMLAEAIIPALSKYSYKLLLQQIVYLYKRFI